MHPQQQPTKFQSHTLICIYGSASSTDFWNEDRGYTSTRYSLTRQSQNSSGGFGHFKTFCQHRVFGFWRHNDRQHSANRPKSFIEAEVWKSSHLTSMGKLYDRSIELEGSNLKAKQSPSPPNSQTKSVYFLSCKMSTSLRNVAYSKIWSTNNNVMALPWLLSLLLLFWLFNSTTEPYQKFCLN